MVQEPAGSATQPVPGENVEDLLRESMDALGHGVAVFGADGRLRWWNVTFTLILPDVAPVLKVGVTLNALLAVISSGKPTDPARTLNAPPLTQQMAGLKHLADGRTVNLRLRHLQAQGMLVEVTDVTDVEHRLRSEALLSVALQSVPAPLLVLDANDRIVMWNRAFIDINPTARLETGLLLEAFLRRHLEVGTLWSHPKDVDDKVQGRMALHRNYTGPFEEWFGDERWFLTTEYPIEGGGVIIMHTDISAQKRAEQEIRRAKRLADEASAAKSAFLANVSHELRTPLNAILGFSELILSEPMGPLGHARYKEYLGDIHGSGQQLLDLINTILDATKVDAGAFELNEGKLEPAREALGVCKQLNLLARRQGVSLVVHMPTPPLVLEADSRAMRQMLTNLLSNAIKFSHAGDQISVTMGHEAQGGWVAVTDTGVGIRPEDIPRVLKPFGQVIEAQNGAHMLGTGLGLPLVKSLIELHGGRLELESALGKGTTARLHFPPSRVR